MPSINSYKTGLWLNHLKEIEKKAQVHEDAEQERKREQERTASAAEFDRLFGPVDDAELFSNKTRQTDPSPRSSRY